MKQFFTLVLSLMTCGLFAQDVAFKKGNFKDDKAGFEKAKANLESGDEWLEKGKIKCWLWYMPLMSTPKP